MKAVMPEVPEHIVQWRKRTGADQWDEMWEGVLHMPPSPSRSHQELEGTLETWLRIHWARPRGNKVFHQINVAAIGGWQDDYRIPDLVLLTPDRFHIDRNEYFEGAPTAVVEIHGPGDEAYGKLSFYAKLGVPETWIIHRDTRVPEVYLLKGGHYEKQPARTDAWIQSPATGIELRAESGPKLAVRIIGNPESLRLLPDE